VNARGDAAVVRVGSVVTIQGHGDVTIVASPRDQGPRRLATRTPLARALLGRRAGDRVEVVTDAGTARFTIAGIR
jgi:transcription elongation GreA/GreB family factor